MLRVFSSPPLHHLQCILLWASFGKRGFPLQRADGVLCCTISLSVSSAAWGEGRGAWGASCCCRTLTPYKRCLFKNFYFYQMICRKGEEDSRTSSTPNTSEPLCRYGSYGKKRSCGFFFLLPISSFSQLNVCREQKSPVDSAITRHHFCLRRWLQILGSWRGSMWAWVTTGLS